MRSAIGLVLLFTIAVVVAVVAAPVPPPRSLAEGVLFTPATCSSAPFSDVAANHPYCAWIQQLKDDQVSSGCGGGKFCPDQPVTRAQISMLLERAMRGTATWDPWRGIFLRTLIVNPVPGNDLASGAQLLAVIASITGASDTNPYLVLVEPGTYDLDDEQIVMPPHTTLRGSGRERTKIHTGADGGEAIVGAEAGTVIEQLRVENINPSALDAIAIDLPGGGTVRGVSAEGFNGLSVGLGIRCQDDCTIEDTDAEGDGGGAVNAGIYILNSATSALLRNVKAVGKTGDFAYGIHVSSANITIEGGQALAHSAGSNWALLFSGSAVEAEVRDFSAEADGLSSADFSAGLRVTNGAVVTVDNSRLESGSGGTRYGLWCLDGEVAVHRSRLIGPNGTVVGAAACSIDIAGSQLAGPAVDDGGGTVRCALNYSENLNVPATTGCF